MKQQVLEKEVIDDLKSEARLIVQHATGGTRADIAKQLNRHRPEFELRLRTSEQAIELHEPHTPDIHIGLRLVPVALTVRISL